MSARNRIPSALEPYLRLPSETSLILLTGTLGCSVNWLTARFAGSLLGNVNPAVEFGSEGVGKETAVILVSFIRDGTFWKNEIKRAMVSGYRTLGRVRRSDWAHRALKPRNFWRADDILLSIALRLCMHRNKMIHSRSSRRLFQMR